MVYLYLYLLSWLTITGIFYLLFEPKTETKNIIYILIFTFLWPVVVVGIFSVSLWNRYKLNN